MVKSSRKKYSQRVKQQKNFRRSIQRELQSAKAHKKRVKRIEAELKKRQNLEDGEINLIRDTIRQRNGYLSSSEDLTSGYTFQKEIPELTWRSITAGRGWGGQDVGKLILEVPPNAPPGLSVPTYVHRLFLRWLLHVRAMASNSSHHDIQAIFRLGIILAGVLDRATLFVTFEKLERLKRLIRLLISDLNTANAKVGNRFVSPCPGDLLPLAFLGERYPPFVLNSRTNPYMAYARNEFTRNATENYNPYPY